ncbi:hypothetical protein COEREDRAFT_80247 [Coemansia reversa NRRL 1564]|uniref:RRM domain-containing protein n=1 Tax=Coemansia reversa (strain ATCC 12441 / NRRL 1564) TaxID=763665 RepID=A0A2G5BG18_COERN|nr:hypothetical protein COEREDRAFT_80247 [Coemansia reversa NRRL 1564]|eukprot:PIA17943.1 hypothetical protein COEREDRAFT_80247 [Coemansia reversa NRRL 1564]
MDNNLDRALDDIIGDSNHSGQQQRLRHSRSGLHGNSNGSDRRNSPYSRHGDGNDHRNRSLHGKWRHDKFDGRKSINDRLGSRPGSDYSSSDRREHRKQHTKGVSDSSRGISIAGRNRDMTLYNEMRVVWVTDLPHDYTSEKIENMFSSTGRIDKVRMAQDKQGRFIGKAEVIYRMADDARDAIQTFDGETLYTTDSSGHVAMHVTYSSPENGSYIDDLRFKDTLPAPRATPISERLGGVAVNAMAAMLPMVPVGPMPVAGMAPTAGLGTRNISESRQRDHNRRRGGYGGRHGRVNRNDSGSRPTAEELDADMDAYMSAAVESANGAASGSAADEKPA